MTIGITFPIKDQLKVGNRKIKTIPWGAIETHRSRAFLNHHLTIERLYALGGLGVDDLARVLLDMDASEKFKDPFDATRVVAAAAGIALKEKTDGKD